MNLTNCLGCIKLICVFQDNKASGTVYLDDNTSFNYVNKEYNYLKIDVDGTDVTLT